MVSLLPSVLVFSSVAALKLSCIAASSSCSLIICVWVPSDATVASSSPVARATVIATYLSSSSVLSTWCVKFIVVEAVVSLISVAAAIVPVGVAEIEKSVPAVKPSPSSSSVPSPSSSVLLFS